MRLKVSDLNHEQIELKIIKNGEFTFSYVILLLASGSIATFGLLMNSSPVVIGGMIISPLMWPIMGVSYGIAHNNRALIRASLLVLISSVVVSLGFSMMIGFISPLKAVNGEILARTTPTIIDLFVALAAGLVASIAIVNTRISDSLAGVAIATSLMPPLCVSGIGISLLSGSIAWGGFLLFITNVIAK